MAKKHSDDNIIRPDTDELKTNLEPETPDQDTDARDEESTEREQIKDLHQDTSDESDAAKEADKPIVSEHRGKFKQFLHWYKTHKKVSIPLTLLVILGVLAAVPWTRYAIAGTFLKQNFTVVVLDSETNKPVSAVSVAVAGKQLLTDGQGKATLHVRVGSSNLDVTKTYYGSVNQKVTVPILKQKTAQTVHLRATGRQVPISVTNKISGKPLEGATIKAGSSEAKTNKKGQAVLVIPADKKTISATIKSDKFNDAAVTVEVTTQTVAANKFTLTPSGKIYFLSNLSGKLDVVKTNLDGSARQTVLAGTGKEDKQNTVLLATTDWKYLALLSRRDGGENSKLFLIETATDKLTAMDEGKASFTLVGWSGHRFVYQVARTEVQYWQPNRVALKSFNAETGQLATLDQTQAEGAQSSNFTQNFGTTYLAGGKAVYATTWDSFPYSNAPTGKTDSIRTIDLSGTNKKDVKTFDSTTTSYIDTTTYEPDSALFRVHPIDSNAAVSYYEYEDDAVKVAQSNEQLFGQIYPTFLASPSGNQTFWSEQRDGKNTLFVGDKSGKSGKQIAVLAEHQTFGWFTDDYLLVSKNSSELYILPAAGGDLLKVSDYYKPAQTFRGYGGGYGGL